MSALYISSSLAGPVTFSARLIDKIERDRDRESYADSGLLLVLSAALLHAANQPGHVVLNSPSVCLETSVGPVSLPAFPDATHLPL